MEHVDLEKLVDKSDGSIYKLVVLISKRALELAEGQNKLVGGINSVNKPSIVALQEIAQGKVTTKGNARATK